MSGWRSWEHQHLVKSSGQSLVQTSRLHLYSAVKCRMRQETTKGRVSVGVVLEDISRDIVQTSVHDVTRCAMTG